MKRRKERPNPVSVAIDLMGGITEVSLICQVSNAAVYKWRTIGRVPDSASAWLLAEACLAAGRLDLTVPVLSGLLVLGDGSPMPPMRRTRMLRRGRPICTYLTSSPGVPAAAPASVTRAA